MKTDPKHLLAFCSQQDVLDWFKKNPRGNFFKIYKTFGYKTSNGFKRWLNMQPLDFQNKVYELHEAQREYFKSECLNVIVPGNKITNLAQEDKLPIGTNQEYFK